MTVEKKKRTRTNHKQQVEDVILYCKVQIEILQSLTGVEAPAINTADRIEAFKSVLRRLNQEVQ